MSSVFILNLLLGCSGGGETNITTFEEVSGGVTATETTPTHTHADGTMDATHTKSTSTTCSMTLFMNDPDPKGLNVRDKASPDGNVIGVLPKGTEFTVIGGKEGWIQYVKPMAFAPDLGLEWDPLEDGPQTGWVFGGLVTTSLRNRHPEGEQTGHFALYPKPDLSVLPTVRWESSDAKNPVNARGTIEKVLNCSGGWLKVDMLDADKKRHTGWLHKENQCPSQVTTCP